MRLLRFITPGGHAAQMHTREGTNDAMAAEAVIYHDEYELANLADIKDGGRYIDIGSHIGSFIVAALLDDPTAEGVAVEPIPENLEVLRQNLEENGLTDRVKVVARAFARKGPVSIAYDFKPLEGASEEQERMMTMHRYIGGQRMPIDLTGATVLKVPAVTPTALFRGGAKMVKIDIEGGEIALVGANLKEVGVISGEYHIARGPLYEHMSKTHRVNFAGNKTFGAFTAVRL